MTNPVVHFEVVGKDGAKLRDFYAGVFGWSFNVMEPMDYGIVDNGGAGAGGGIGTAPAPMSTFYIAVADPQAALNAVEANGGKTTMPVMEIPGVVTLAQFSDPDGNIVGLVKDDGTQPPPSAAPPAANPVTWFEVQGKDGGRSREFYSKVFSWKYEVAPDMDYGMVQNEDQGIGGGVGGGDTAHAIFYVEVPDLQATLDKIESGGGKTVMPVTDMGMVTIAQFTDPEGNPVGLFKSNQ